MPLIGMWWERDLRKQRTLDRTHTLIHNLYKVQRIKLSMIYKPTLDEIASIVSASTGDKEFEYLPRYDIALPDKSRVALIAPNHRYARWHGFNDKIVFWDALEDGPYHFVASRRAGVTTVAIDEKYPLSIPVYDLQRMNVTAAYPEHLEGRGTPYGSWGSATDTAREHYEGKFLYGITLDSGLKVLVAGDAPEKNSYPLPKMDVSADVTGRRDLIGRPIYLASRLVSVGKAA